MLAAAIGWALYSIYLFYWKTKLEIFQRFTLVAFFGAVSLLPFYVGEEIFFQKTVFSQEFFIWVLFAAISKIKKVYMYMKESFSYQQRKYNSLYIRFNVSFTFTLECFLTDSPMSVTFLPFEGDSI